MSTGPSLSVVTADPTPPYEQLRRQLVQLIESGVLADGDRLPPLRQLAADLGLAVGTVARTYRELESAGLAVSRRGGGTRVLSPTARRSRAELERALREHADSYVRQGLLLGADEEAMRTALGAALSEAASARARGHRVVVGH